MYHIDVYAANKMIETHGKAGGVDRALDIFQKLGSWRDSFSWDLMLLAALRNERVKLAKDLFAAMPVLTPYSCSAVMGAFADNGDFVEAKRLFDRFPGKNLVVWTMMLESLARIGDVSGARMLFEEMPMRDLYAWNTMLSVYAKNGHLKTCLELLGEIPELSIISCTLLLKAFSESLESAIKIFDQMLYKDQACWNVMLHTYVVNDRLDLVDFSCPSHDLISWNIILATFVRTGNVSEAKRMFDTMPELNIISWNTMLAAYAGSGQLEETRALFSDMPKHNLQSATTIMAACAVASPKHLQCARETLRQLPILDLIACNATVASLACNGALEEARHLQDSMLILDSCSCTSILVAYAQHGHLLEALQMFHGMPCKDPATWTALLVIYARDGRLDLARAIFDRMPEKCLVSCTAMLNSCAQNGNFKLALALFHETNLIVLPDEACFSPVLISSTGSIASVRKCFHSIRFDYNLEASRHHYSCVVGILSKAGHLDDARELLQNMSFVPDSLEWRCLLSNCLSHNDLHNGSFASEHIVKLSSDDITAYTLLANTLNQNSIIVK